MKNGELLTIVYMQLYTYHYLYSVYVRTFHTA